MFAAFPTPVSTEPLTLHFRPAASATAASFFALNMPPGLVRRQAAFCRFELVQAQLVTELSDHPFEGAEEVDEPARPVDVEG